MVSPRRVPVVVGTRPSKSRTLPGRLGCLTGRTSGKILRPPSRLGVFPEVEAVQPLDSVGSHKGDDGQIMTSV